MGEEATHWVLKRLPGNRAGALLTHPLGCEDLPEKAPTGLLLSHQGAAQNNKGPAELTGKPYLEAQLKFAGSEHHWVPQQQ